MPEPDRRRVAVLVSGNGRNLGALLKACEDGRIEGRIVLVASSRADAPALERAHRAGVETVVVPHAGYPDRDAFDAELARRIDGSGAGVVALAGFMRILTPAFVRRYEGRLLNIHPSLLPRHPGLRTHERALAAGDAEHGATVHYVTPELDAGPAIIQGCVSVRAQDDAVSLAEQVMQAVELKIYPQAVAWAVRGEISLRDGSVLRHDAPLARPLTLDDLEPAFR